MTRNIAARAPIVDAKTVLHETSSLAAGPALDAVLHWVGDGVWIDLEGVNRVNPTGRLLLGLGPDDDPNLGQGLTKIASLDGRVLGPEDVPAAQARSLERAVSYRVRITRQDGVELVVDGTAAPIIQGGRVCGTVTTFRDVTDEHNRTLLTERLLEQLFEALPIGVVVAHPESGEILSANRSFGELIGHAPEELLGTQAPYPWEAEVPELDFRVGDEIDASIREGSFRRKDGRFVPVEITPLIVREDNGSAVADVRLISDLSERRLFEHQIVQTGKLAAIGELAAGVAHEINNPLFAILGLVEFLLKDSEPGTKQHDRLELIQRTGLEIKDVVRALLDFAGERSDEFDQVSLNELVSQTLHLIRRTSLRKDVEIIEVYPPAPLYVRASTGQLKQVFLNLMTNAQQAMSGAGTVTVCLERDRDCALVHVTDTGSGIADDVIDRIFDPFFTTKRELGGTGLGLALSQSIAVAHNGSLTGVSLPGGGAQFTLHLPLLGEWR